MFRGEGGRGEGGRGEEFRGKKKDKERGIIVHFICFVNS